MLSLLSLFAVVLALFMLPGCIWARWLHRDDRFGWSLQATLGFIWSFGVFSLLGGPFLWFGGTFNAFLTAACVVWPTWLMAGVWLWWRSPTSARHGENEEPMAEQAERAAGSPAALRGPAGYALAILYAVVAALCLYYWAEGRDDWQERILALCPIVLGVGTLAACLLSRPLGRYLQFTAEDEQQAPLLWRAVAVILIGGQAVAASVLFRPDWDDCFNLAAVRDYRESPFLNSRNPVSLDPGTMNATHRVLCLELWGSVLCRMTGADPQSLFHSLLPGLFVLACYASYSALIGEIVPRRWLALSLIGLSAYYVFGICGSYGGANHFLIRIWQGKALLPHLAMPVTATMLLRFARHRDVASWASLVASVCAGLGFSTSAIFLDAALIGCFSIALLPVACRAPHAGRPDNWVRRAVLWRALVFLSSAAATTLPLAAEAVAIVSSMQRGEQVGHSGAPVAAGPTAGHAFHVWFLNLNETTTHQGCADLLWLFALPALGLLLFDYRRRAYPVAYPLLLLLTFANPWLCYNVATYVTSKDTYYRLFWLLPVGPGLGMTFALLGRLARKAGAEAAGPLWHHLPLVVASAGGLLLAALPGMFVWGPDNNNGPYMVTRPGANLQKMPPDIIRITRELERDRHLEEHPILSGEEVASFLAPCSSRFRYVTTRLFYLPGFGVDPQYRAATEQYLLLQLAYAGRKADELRKLRYLVGATATIQAEMVYQAGRLPPLPQSNDLPQMAEIPQLLRRHRVDYLITSPPLWLDGPGSDEARRELIAQRSDFLHQLGYRESYAGDDYSLWQWEGK